MHIFRSQSPVIHKMDEYYEQADRPTPLLVLRSLTASDYTSAHVGWASFSALLPNRSC